MVCTYCYGNNAFVVFIAFIVSIVCCFSFNSGKLQAQLNVLTHLDKPPGLHCGFLALESKSTFNCAELSAG